MNYTKILHYLKWFVVQKIDLFHAAKSHFVLQRQRREHDSITSRLETIMWARSPCFQVRNMHRVNFNQSETPPPAVWYREHDINTPITSNFVIQPGWYLRMVQEFIDPKMLYTWKQGEPLYRLNLHASVNKIYAHLSVMHARCSLDKVVLTLYRQWLTRGILQACKYVAYTCYA